MIWYGLESEARSQGSLAMQVNIIKKGGYLSLEEMEAIERRLRDGRDVLEGEFENGCR